MQSLVNSKQLIQQQLTEAQTKIDAVLKQVGEGSTLTTAELHFIVNFKKEGALELQEQLLQTALHARVKPTFLEICKDSIGLEIFDDYASTHYPYPLWDYTDMAYLRQLGRNFQKCIERDYRSFGEIFQIKIEPVDHLATFCNNQFNSESRELVRENGLQTTWLNREMYQPHFNQFGAHFRSGGSMTVIVRDVALFAVGGNYHSFKISNQKGRFTFDEKGNMADWFETEADSK